MEEKRESKQDTLFRQIGLYSIVGIYFVVATFLGLALGYYLDKYLGTKPWLTLLFLLFGIAAGFINLFRSGVSARKQ